MMVKGTTRVVGVFGAPVRHSCSPPMHNAAFAALGLDFIYVPFEVSPEQLSTAVMAVRALGMPGVNVTIPHKAG
ncbi:MAG: shikimate dehydrogenase, partial [Armatimonadota bacterium]